MKCNGIKPNGVQCTRNGKLIGPDGMHYCGSHIKQASAKPATPHKKPLKLKTHKKPIKIKTHITSTSCKCGHNFQANHVKKFEDYVSAEQEFELWQTVIARLGKTTASQYFSLPIDQHKCEYTNALIFTHHGNDLTSKKVSIKSAQDLAKIFFHVAEGIKLLNQVGIIHRDIKPDNIVVNGDYSVKIIDIGNAYIIGRNTIAITPSIDLKSKTINTPNYLFYPVHKCYLEDWVNNLNSSNLIDACELSNQYCEAHCDMISNYLPVYYRLKLHDDYNLRLRTKLMDIYSGNAYLPTLQTKELQKWDIYSLGMTIVVTYGIFNLSVDSLFKLGFEMLKPNNERPEITEVIEKLHQQIAPPNTIKNEFYSLS